VVDVITGINSRSVYTNFRAFGQPGEDDKSPCIEKGLSLLVGEVHRVSRSFRRYWAVVIERR